MGAQREMGGKRGMGEGDGSTVGRRGHRRRWGHRGRWEAQREMGAQREMAKGKKKVGEQKRRYSAEELSEFKRSIELKIEKARKELEHIGRLLNQREGLDTGAVGLPANNKLVEDGGETLSREQLSHLASRQQKFVGELEKALERIRLGVYGVCVDTGKLIPKERLRAVPHTMHSIEAKTKRF